MIGKNSEEMVKLTGVLVISRFHWIPCVEGSAKTELRLLPKLLQMQMPADSNGVSADAGLAAGERVAGPVQRFVFLVVVFAEGAKGPFAFPAVDRQVVA